MTADLQGHRCRWKLQPTTVALGFQVSHLGLSSFCWSPPKLELFALRWNARSIRLDGQSLQLRQVCDKPWSYGHAIAYEIEVELQWGAAAVF